MSTDTAIAAPEQQETQEELQLSLYILRSDFNRAVALADRLRRELLVCEERESSSDRLYQQLKSSRDQMHQELQKAQVQGNEAQSLANAALAEVSKLQQRCSELEQALGDAQKDAANQRSEKEQLNFSHIQLQSWLGTMLEEKANAATRLFGELQLDLKQILQELNQAELRGQQLLETTRTHNFSLSSGLLSRFQMIASEVSTIKQIRSGELALHGNVDFLRLLYLDLLERALTGSHYGDPPMNEGLEHYDPDLRLKGWDWPSKAHSMIGRARMRNIRDIAEKVLAKDVPGDFLEAGVWRGGACIFMRGLLAAYNMIDRRVWVADSFAGPPAPDYQLYPADNGQIHHTFEELAVSLDEVKSNFAKYNLLDGQVRFLPGLFKDTLPKAPIERLAILRIDAEMYGSTKEALQALYFKLSPGGYVIVDNYFLSECRQAVTDFRVTHDIKEDVVQIDSAAVYWRVDPSIKKQRRKAIGVGHRS